MDDRRLEEYLRSFRPRRPEPLPRRGRRWTIVALGAAAAVVMGALLSQWSGRPGEPSVAAPITIGSANQILARASSWKAAIDDAGFAFRASPTTGVAPHRSALEFLSQEDLSK